MEYPFKDLLPLDEVLDREGYYKDWTHLDPKVFYSLTQISEYIKTKGYGVDVRLLIAQLAEHFGLKTTQVVDLANLLQQKFTNLEGVTRNFTNNINSLVSQMQADKDAVIANATADSEVILARGGKPTLGARLDETTSQLAHVTRNYSEPQATFVIVDDDARDTVWTYLKPLLDSKGIKATISVPASYIDTPNFLTSAQVVELSEQGWDIANHANTNIKLGEQTPSVIRQEFTESQNFLKSLGIDTRTLVYPMGSYSQSVVDIATEYFDAALIDQGSENYGKLNTYAIKRLGIGTVGTTNLTNIKGSVDRTIANGGLCILMTHVQHHVADAPIIEETIDYILSKGGVFKTFKDAFEEHRNIMEIGRYDTSKNYSNFTLSKNGEVYFDGDRGYYTNVNTTLPSSSTPSAYKLGVTINNYPDSASSDLPRGLGGTVITIKALNSNNRYNIQYYFKYETGEMHTRMGLSDDTWGDWKSDVKLINTQIRPFTAPASEYPLGVTLAYYSTADSSDTPNGVGGTLTTYIASPTNHNYNYQEFKEYGNNRVYTRSAITDGSWRAWNKLSDAP